MGTISNSDSPTPRRIQVEVDLSRGELLQLPPDVEPGDIVEFTVLGGRVSNRNKYSVLVTGPVPTPHSRYGYDTLDVTRNLVVNIKNMITPSNLEVCVEDKNKPWYGKFDKKRSKLKK